MHRRLVALFDPRQNKIVHSYTYDVCTEGDRDAYAAEEIRMNAESMELVVLTHDLCQHCDGLYGVHREVEYEERNSY